MKSIQHADRKRALVYNEVWLMQWSVTWHKREQYDVDSVLLMLYSENCMYDEDDSNSLHFPFYQKKSIYELFVRPCAYLVLVRRADSVCVCV